LLNDAIADLAVLRLPPDLYGGVTGIAWAIAHLRDLLGDVDLEITRPIDRLLRDHLRRKPWRGDYDLVGGLAGYGVYALEQLPRALAIKHLKCVIKRLEETARRTRIGVAWFTRAGLLPEWQRELCPRGYYNLGLAHGVPGVIAMLGRASAAEAVPRAIRAKARSLLDGAVSWLLANKEADNTNGFFPGWSGPGVAVRPGRVAWCYGDLGVAVALLLAARCVNETDWENEAIVIARDVARRPVGRWRVRDPGLCHGAAGVGHLFNRLFQATGDRLFKATARFWFERALEMRRDGKGIAGFSALQIEPNKQPYRVPAPGLLEGAAGIGLALLAATTNVEPAWDRMLLVSIPPRRCRS
jgi:lantibiotic modifying enzyme